MGDEGQKMLPAVEGRPETLTLEAAGLTLPPERIAGLNKEGDIESF
jgi:hypothetical protein